MRQQGKSGLGLTCCQEKGMKALNATIYFLNDLSETTLRYVDREVGGWQWRDSSLKGSHSKCICVVSAGKHKSQKYVTEENFMEQILDAQAWLKEVYRGVGTKENLSGIGLMEGGHVGLTQVLDIHVDMSWR